MSAVQRYAIKSCCRAASICERCIEPEVLPDGDRSILIGDTHGVVEVEALRPRYNVHYIAAHEAAHAAVVHALGATIDYVDADELLRVRHRGAGLTWRARAIVALAGDFGATWHWRHDPWIDRLSDDAVRDYIAAIRSVEFGICDYCTALFAVSMIVGFKTPDELYVAEFRSIERETIEIVQQPEIVQAIRCLAELLLDVGRVDGETAHAVIERHVPFGSITIEGINSLPRA